MKYIATFFNHFGAIRYKKMCLSRGWEATLCPVPRSLSSSCGTCVIYHGSEEKPSAEIPEEVEQIVRESEDGYVCLYRAEDS